MQRPTEEEEDDEAHRISQISHFLLERKNGEMERVFVLKTELKIS